MYKPTPKQRVLFPLYLRRVLLAVFLVSVLGASIISALTVQPAQAATSSTINFQARLQTNSGAIVGDGFYNVQFKLYSAAAPDGGETPIAGSCTTNPGGVADEDCLWTETYYDSNGGTAGNDNRVRVQNGYLSVALGSQTAFPSTIDWDQQLYLTMNIGGTTQTATPTYDGEMNPRLALSAVPYAFRAGQLAKQTGSFQSTLDFATQTGSRTLLLPDESGTLCVRNSAACGFLTGSVADGNYIQNGTAEQVGANFNISGTGTVGGNLTVNGQGIFRNDANSNAALSVQNASGAAVFQVDTTSPNYVSNPGFEADVTTGWASLLGTETRTQHTTGVNTYYGEDSMNLTTPATANAGARVTGFTATPTFATSATWNFSFYAKLASGSMTTLQAGFNVGAGDTNCTISSGTLSTSGFNRYSCTITLTSGQSISSVYIRQSDAVARTLYIDAVQLIPGSAALPYQPGAIKLRGVVTTPAAFRADANSTTAFQVQNAAGTGNNLVVDTLNSIVYLNNTVRIANGSYGAVLNVAGTQTNRTNNAAAFQVQNSSAVPIFLVDSATNTSGNRVTNYGFEADTSNWANITGGTLTRQTTLTNAYGGVASGQIVTTATAGAGARTTAFTGSVAAGTYTMSFYAKSSTAMTTLAAGYNQTAGSPTGNDVACTLNSTNVATNGFNRYSCTFTATATIVSIWIEQTDAVARTIYIDGVQLVPGNAAVAYTVNGAVQLRGAVNAPIVFQNASNSTTAFQIQDSLGTSNLFVADTLNNRVNVAGSLNSTGTALFRNTSNSVTAFQIQNANGDSMFNVDTTGAQPRIGIGTAAPSELLHVVSSSGAVMSIETTATGSTAYSEINTKNGNGVWSKVGNYNNTGQIGTVSNHDLQFLTNNATRLTIAAGGTITTQGNLSIGNGINMNSTAITNASNIGLTGTINGGTTISASGNITSSGGTVSGSNVNATGNLQTGGNTRIDATGNITGATVNVTGSISGTIIYGVAGDFTGYKTDNTSNTLPNGSTTQWTKLGTCTITSQYSDCASGANIVLTGDGGSTNARATVNWRVKQQNAFGGNPSVTLDVYDVDSIVAAQLQSVVTSNAGPTVVELWGNIRDQYQGWAITPFINAGSTRVIWLSNQGFVSAPTAGGTLYTNAVYADQISNSVNSITGYSFNGTAGSTTTCTGGQFLQNAVVQGGIVTGGSCSLAAGDGGVTSVGTFSTTNTAAGGATISGTQIIFQAASASAIGMVTTSAQTFGGAKTFNSTLTVSSGGASISGGLNNNSGNITNVGSLAGVTSLTLNGAISGGTTISASGNISGQTLTSTVATGTAPLSVTSTTKVNNLNADQLDGLDSTAFATATGGSGYIQNNPGSQQPGANFNIGGSGTIGTNLTVTGAATVNGEMYAAGSLRLADGYRKYNTTYSTTIANNTPIKIGEFTYGGDFQNISISGTVRGQSGSPIGISRFMLSGRADTLPAKTFVFTQNTEGTANIQILAYQNTATGRVVLAYASSSSLLNVGWDIDVVERANYNYFQNTTTYQVLDTTGLTAITETSGYTQTMRGNVNATGVFQVNGTSGAAISCSGGQLLQNAVVAGGIVTGGSCVAPVTGGVTVVGAIDSQTKNANGAVISGNTIYLQTADASNPGLVSTGAQTFAGNKTLSGTTNFTGNVQTNGTQRLSNAGALSNITGYTQSSGNATFNQNAADQFRINALQIPTSDMVMITNTGQPVTTAGINGMQVDYYGGAANIEASAARFNITPGSTSGGVWNAVRVVAGAASTGVTSNAIKLESTAGTGTQNGLYFGTGWDALINYNGTAILNGSGVLQSAGLSGTYSGAITLSNASNAFTGVGTNLTALNASNLGSGTVASARISGAYGNITGVGTLTGLTLSGAITGATSVSSTGNISGSTLTSTVATGTAPLTVTSTTKVNNLNADQLDGLDSTAFATATGGSGYIQNNPGSQQAGANFNIGGNGTLGGNLTVTGTVTQNNTLPVYKWRTGGNNGTDSNWKTIANVTMNTGLYQAASFIIDVEDANCNFGCSSDGIHQKYYASMTRSGGVLNDIDSASVSGPNANYVRVVKTATGVYELQVNQPADWRHVNFTVQANSASAAVSYVTNPADGSTTGTIYTATVQHIDYMTRLTVAGATTIQAGGLNMTNSGITNAGNISGVGTLAATGNISTTGSLTAASIVVGNTANQVLTMNAGAGNHSVEIGRTDGTASSPYLDFHSGATATDYDARIMASGGNGSNGGGTLALTAGTTNVTGNLQTNGTQRISSTGAISNITGYTQSNGNATFNQNAADQFRILASQAPTTDMMQVSNSGQAVTTANINGMQIDYFGGAAAVEAGAARFNITPGSTSGGTWNATRVVAGATAAGVTTNGMKLETSAGSGTQNGLYFGQNWTSLLNYNGTSIISGTGVLQSAGLSGTYSNALTFSSSSNAFTGVGTNLTALNASNLGSGTVNTARISGSYGNITGVGTLTSLTMSGAISGVTTLGLSGQLTSTVATGTAPMVIASTTKVTNLNADLLDGLDSTAFAPATGSTSYIRNTTTQQTADFNISGNGTIGGTLNVTGAINSQTISATANFTGTLGVATSVTTPLLRATTLDTASAVALNIGTTNATGINMNKTMTLSAGSGIVSNVGSGYFDMTNATGYFATSGGENYLNGNVTVLTGKTLTVGGDTLIQGADSLTKFRIQDAGGWDTFTADTVNNRIGINGVTAPGTNLDINGGFQMTGMSTPYALGGDINKWSKIGECSITAQNGVCSTTINILGVQNVAGKSSQATVSARVHQSGAMGTAPVIALQISGALEGFAFDDIQTSTVTNTGSLTKVELYISAPVGDDQYYYSPSLNIPTWGGARWIWTPDTAWVTAMPGGLKTLAEYATTNSGNVIFEGGLQAGDRQIFYSNETAAQTYNVTGRETAYRIHTNSTSNASFTTTVNLTDHEFNGSILFIRLDAQKSATAASQTHRTTLQMNGTTVAHVETDPSLNSVFKTKMFILMRTGGNWHVMLGGTTLAANAGTAYNLADLAEFIPYSGVRPEAGELVMPGDPVNHPAGVSAKRTSGNADRAMGVISTTPAETYGEEDDESVPMALTGRVPVKVSLENGPIQPGDFLTQSSTPGVAMKATEPGHMIGTALTGYAGNGEAKVMTQLAFGYNVPPASNPVQGIEELQGQVNTLQGGLQNLANRVDAMGVSFNTGTLSSVNLTVTGNATIGGDLEVKGTTKLQKLELSGHLVTKGELPTLELQAAAGNQTPVAPLLPASATIKGNDVSGTITLVIGENATAEDLVKVNFHQAYAEAPQVLITPVGKEGARLGAYIDGVSGSEFYLGATNLPESQKTYVFNYHVMQAASQQQ